MFHRKRSERMSCVTFWKWLERNLNCEVWRQSRAMSKTEISQPQQPVTEGHMVSPSLSIFLGVESPKNFLNGLILEVF